MIIVPFHYVELVLNTYLNSVIVITLVKQNSLSRNPREFQQFVRKNKLLSGIHSHVGLDNIRCTDTSDIPNLFLESFKSLYCESATTLVYTSPYNLPHDLLSNAYFSIKDVYQQLIFLHGNLSLGLDSIPGYFYLTYVTSSLSYYGFYLKNRLMRAFFPSALKISILLPLLKTENASKV